MYHFFASPENIRGNDIYIEGEDYNHIRNVLRMKAGEVISVSDGLNGTEYRCHVEDFEEDRVHCRLDFKKEADIELPVKIYLFQGLPKSDKMEFIIQKAVELGVYEIIPVATARAVVKLDDKRAASKSARWNMIAQAAAKQSGRGVIPKVREVMTFRSALKEAANMDVRLIPYELSEGFDATRNVINDMQEGASAAVFIGPEGGFDEKEIQEAVKNGILPLSMGKRILRTETAGMVFLSWIVYRFER